MGLFTATEPAAALAFLSCESGLLNDALHASAQKSRDEVIQIPFTPAVPESETESNKL